MSHRSGSRGDSTRLIHTASGDAVRSNNESVWSISPPIYQTTSFAYATTDRAAESCAAPRASDCYTRYGNPNFDAVIEAISQLERAEDSLATGSGMGAISLILLTFLKPGDHVVAQKTHYAATSQALRHHLPRLGIEVTQVDASIPEAFEEALRPNSRLILIETPANPLITLTDLDALGSLGRSRGVLTCVDSTLATPVNQRPCEHGIDLTVHSATKYFGGHSDVTAGTISGRRAHIEQLWQALIVFGMVLHPFEAWLLARGLQTLPMRMALHNENALALARALEAHPRVKSVHYPGLRSHPQYALARKQMGTGCGGVLSFEVDGDYEDAKRVVDRLDLAQRAVSLGGTKTLAVHVASMIYPHVDAETRELAGVSDTLIRVSVGLEDRADIIADFDSALSTG